MVSANAQLMSIYLDGDLEPRDNSNDLFHVTSICSVEEVKKRLLFPVLLHDIPLHVNRLATTCTKSSPPLDYYIRQSADLIFRLRLLLAEHDIQYSKDAQTFLNYNQLPFISGTFSIYNDYCLFNYY